MNIRLTLRRLTASLLAAALSFETFLPTLMLSGFIFPIASMPTFLQVVTRIVPARYFLVALRGIVLKGVGPADFLPDVIALVIYAVVILALASVRVRRQWA